MAIKECLIFTWYFIIRLTELMSHAESHDPEFRRQNDDNIYMGQQLSPYATQV